ncbi:MAG: hypothetical protein Q9209_007530 [Squamulea sp. 1 TL-2023]
MLDYSAAAGAIHGYDFAGTIVALGTDAAALDHLVVGDGVVGLVHGTNKLQPDVGAFAEYFGASTDLLLKIPNSMSLEEAASFGRGVATASIGLFSELGVPAFLEKLREGKPAENVEDREFILVAGGSTATGIRAIQLLKLAGLRPIATRSPGNNDLVYRLGAEKVFDYSSPTCAEDIHAYTQNERAFALDCVSQAETTQLLLYATPPSAVLVTITSHWRPSGKPLLKVAL